MLFGLVKGGLLLIRHGKHGMFNLGLVVLVSRIICGFVFIFERGLRIINFCFLNCFS